VDNKNVDSAIRQALGRTPPESSGSCPDPNMTAAYLENRLTDDEMAAFETHASDCPQCRELLALAMKLEEKPGTGPSVIEPAVRRYLFRISIPVSALALFVTGAALGIIFLRSSKSPVSGKPAAQTAELRAPAPPPEPSPEQKLNESVAPPPAPVRKPVAVKSAPAPLSDSESSKKAESMKQAIAQQAPAAVPEAVPTGIAELDTGKAQTQQLSAAKTEFAATRGDDAGQRQAAQSRGATAGYAGNAVGGVVGGIPPPSAPRTQRVSMLSAAPTPKEAIMTLGRMLSTAVQSESRTAKDAAADLKSDERSRKIGNHRFILTSGYWIDEVCGRNTDAPIVEVTAGAPEFDEIIKLYPDLRPLLPAIVYWNEKALVLR